jgi:hypothetical protein
MNDWTFAQQDATEELARLHFFSIKKHQDGRDIEFTITVKEFAKPNAQSMLFFAQADQQTNQKTAPFTPSGWGDTLLKALSECIQAIHRFPYEGSKVR